MTAYQIGIVGHTARQEYVDALTEALHPEFVSVDDGTLGASGNHLKVLKTLYEMNPAAWIIILEDDAQPVDGLRDQIVQCLAVAPAKLISFYAGTGYPAQYQQYFTDAITDNPDVCWLLHAQLRHGVAYGIHPLVAKAVLIRVEELVAKKYAPDDAISWWATRSGEMIGYTNPSLVDHRDLPTVVDYRFHIGHVTGTGRNRPRHAYRVGTRETWDSGSVPVGPTADRYRQQQTQR